MKNNISVNSLLLLVALILFSGCDEKYGVTTVISRDGSCDRIITLSRSSRDLSTTGFPLPIDSSWETSWKEPEKKGENWTFTARKSFPRFDSLELLYVRQTGAEKLHIRPHLEKKFQWFYTYFVYDETYERFDPFQALPPGAVMSNDEIRRIVAGEKSDSLQKKFKEWDSRNGYEMIFQRLREAAKTLHDPRLSDALLNEKKEEIYEALMKDGKTSGAKGKGRDTSAAGQAIEMLAGVLPASSLEKLRQPINEIAQEWIHKSEVSSRISGEYTNTVVMPGVILTTNATEVKGNSATWSFAADQLRLVDYGMHVESRTINTWSFAATGALFLVLIAAPFAVRYTRRRNNLQ